ncbi:hypothetical protein FIBSPDRAFT_867052 [Athelia psychrophila]|uniref:Uncharacterized protein n=1 Tax=Athelia psychrophila TaxID=1759441 RepID=A0A166EDN0_9AGAM|nr:hypothetical protein FIBSPDRAFT_867052 [Fibularhizoctonia sp. CBS 109695]
MGDLVNSWTAMRFLLASWRGRGERQSPSYLGVMRWCLGLSSEFGTVVTVTWLLWFKDFPHWHHGDLFLNP